eukprot:scaffold495951_cov51-Prasinocladus_malaysianus.AAC.1
MLRAHLPKPLIGHGGALSTALGRLRTMQGAAYTGLLFAASTACGMSFLAAFAPLRCSGTAS